VLSRRSCGAAAITEYDALAIIGLRDDLVTLTGTNFVGRRHCTRGRTLMFRECGGGWDRPTQSNGRHQGHQGRLELHHIRDLPPSALPPGCDNVHTDSANLNQS
jgi:hypothetical protein